MSAVHKYSSIESGVSPFSIEKHEGSDEEEEGSSKKAHPLFRVKIEQDKFNACNIFMYFGLFILAVTLSYVIILITQTFSCLGAPYLYVTHGNSRNIMKFSRDGCLINPKVLWGVASRNSELRGMYIDKYQGEEALYVADTENGIAVFGQCFHDTSMRPLITTVVTPDQNPGVQHAYSVKRDFEGNVYASFQHTDVVMRFAKDTFGPIPPPRNLSTLEIVSSKGSVVRTKGSSGPPGSTDYFYNGTFVQFGQPGLHNTTAQGVRDILWVRNYTQLWIANEDLSAIIVVDQQGTYIGSIALAGAIGLYSTEALPFVFCSSKSKKNGAVYAINKDTLSIERTYKVIGMSHPTALVSFEDTLFVGDQTRNVLISFNITSQRYIRQVVAESAMPGVIEQMILSDC
jgi:hypothetical protein